MIDKKEWSEFRNTGLLLIINQTLHIFGWAICCELDDDTGNIISVYPARVKFRGFSEKSTQQAYVKISDYIHKNHEQLKKEANEEN